LKKSFTTLRVGLWHPKNKTPNFSLRPCHQEKHMGRSLGLLKSRDLQIVGKVELVILRSVTGSASLGLGSIPAPVRLGVVYYFGVFIPPMPTDWLGGVPPNCPCGKLGTCSLNKINWLNRSLSHPRGQTVKEDFLPKFLFRLFGFAVNKDTGDNTHRHMLDASRRHTTR